MKRCTWMLVAAAALALAAGSALAAEKASEPAATPTVTPTAPAKAPAATPTVTPTAPAKAPAATPTAPATSTAAAATSTEAKPALEGELVIMVKECKCTDEQIAKITEVTTAGRAALEAWHKENVAKLEAIQKARDAALMANDQAGLLKAMNDIAPLRQEFEALQMKYSMQVANTLTEDQKNVWRSYLLWRNIVDQLKQLVDLKDDQAAKVRPLCDAAAKDISALKPDDPNATLKAMEIRNDILTKIRDTIMTDEQRKALEKLMGVPIPTGTAAAPTSTAKPAETTTAAKPAEKPAEKPAAPTPTAAPKAEK